MLQLTEDNWVTKLILFCAAF